MFIKVNRICFKKADRRLPVSIRKATMRFCKGKAGKMILQAGIRRRSCGMEGKGASD